MDDEGSTPRSSDTIGGKRDMEVSNITNTISNLENTCTSTSDTLPRKIPKLDSTDQFQMQTTITRNEGVDQGLQDKISFNKEKDSTKYSLSCMHKVSGRLNESINCQEHVAPSIEDGAHLIGESGSKWQVTSHDHQREKPEIEFNKGDTTSHMQQDSCHNDCPERVAFVSSRHDSLYLMDRSGSKSLSAINHHHGDYEENSSHSTSFQLQETLKPRLLLGVADKGSPDSTNFSCLSGRMSSSHSATNSGSNGLLQRSNNSSELQLIHGSCTSEHLLQSDSSSSQNHSGDAQAAIQEMHKTRSMVSSRPVESASSVLAIRGSPLSAALSDQEDDGVLQNNSQNLSQSPTPSIVRFSSSPSVCETHGFMDESHCSRLSSSSSSPRKLHNTTNLSLLRGTVHIASIPNTVRSLRNSSIPKQSSRSQVNFMNLNEEPKNIKEGKLPEYSSLSADPFLANDISQHQPHTLSAAKVLTTNSSLPTQPSKQVQSGSPVLFELSCPRKSDQHSNILTTFQEPLIPVPYWQDDQKFIGNNTTIFQSCIEPPDANTNAAKPESKQQRQETAVSDELLVLRDSKDDGEHVVGSIQNYPGHLCSGVFFNEMGSKNCFTNPEHVAIDEIHKPYGLVSENGCNQSEIDDTEVGRGEIASSLISEAGSFAGDEQEFIESENVSTHERGDSGVLVTQDTRSWQRNDYTSDGHLMNRRTENRVTFAACDRDKAYEIAKNRFDVGEQGNFKIRSEKDYHERIHTEQEDTHFKSNYSTDSEDGSGGHNKYNNPGTRPRTVKHIHSPEKKQSDPFNITTTKEIYSYDEIVSVDSGSDNTEEEQEQEEEEDQEDQEEDQEEQQEQEEDQEDQEELEELEQVQEEEDQEDQEEQEEQEEDQEEEELDDNDYTDEEDVDNSDSESSEDGDHCLSYTAGKNHKLNDRSGNHETSDFQYSKSIQVSSYNISDIQENEIPHHGYVYRILSGDSNQSFPSENGTDSDSSQSVTTITEPNDIVGLEDHFEYESHREEKEICSADETDVIDQDDDEVDELNCGVSWEDAKSPNNTAGIKGENKVVEKITCLNSETPMPNTGSTSTMVPVNNFDEVSQSPTFSSEAAQYVTGIDQVLSYTESSQKTITSISVNTDIVHDNWMKYDGSILSGLEISRNIWKAHKEYEEMHEMNALFHRRRRKKDEDFTQIFQRLSIDAGTNSLLVLPRLTRDDESQVEKIWRSGGDDDILSENVDLRISVKRFDLRTLEGKTWLNDMVINTYMALILDRSQKQADEFPHVWTFNSFFYQKLKASGYNGVRRWTRKAKPSVFAYDKLIIPINVNSMHWCCGCVDFKKKTIEYYDSMHQSAGSFHSELRMWLNEEWKSRKNGEPFDFSGWRNVTSSNCPHQTNCSDCGVFASQFAECLSRNAKFWFTQRDMAELRKRMVSEIVEQKLAARSSVIH
eukprot:gene6212-7425_t